MEYDIKTTKNARSELEDFEILFCDLRNRSELFFALCIFTKKFVNTFQDFDILKERKTKVSLL